MREAVGSAFPQAEYQRYIVHQIRNTMKYVVEKGRNYLIFPEGTRTPGDDMLEFKEGSFKIAEKSGCLIIPVAITNTENVFENHIPFIKASTVIIEFGDPIDLNAMPKEERRHIGSQVQGIIGGMLKENSLANVES